MMGGLLNARWPQRILALPWRMILTISLIGAFALMYALGFTVNTLTLLSMVLAIGLVVDDAIVVLENIMRYIEQGLSPREAALSSRPCLPPSRCRRPPNPRRSPPAPIAARDRCARPRPNIPRSPCAGAKRAPCCCRCWSTWTASRWT